jgi:hypothetical protein
MSDSEGSSVNVDSYDGSKMSGLWLMAIVVFVIVLIIWIVWPYGNITATGTVSAPHGSFSSTLYGGTISQSNHVHASVEGVVGATGAATVVEFDAADASGITYDDSTFTFTVPKTGYYAANLTFSSVVNGRIYVKNETSSVVMLQTYYNSTAAPLSVGGVLYAEAGDEFKVYYNFTTTSTFDALFDMQCINAV